MHNYVIIVAGGKGERMGGETPKQFVELANKPILMHTIEKFNTAFQNNIEIILVLPSNQFDYWDSLCKKHSFVSPVLIAEGGKTRFDSVKNGLALVKKNSIVGIHDGVRPLVSTDVIKNTYKTAEEFGTAIPAIDVIESLRKVTPEKNEAVKRSCYQLIQTPQCFQSELILSAYEQDFDSSFTDDASVVENAGNALKLVEGNKQNIKITTPEDLLIANAFLQN